MRVILLSDQRHLGTRGQVVDVKPGFARNYLLPRGIALEATTGNLAYFQQQKAKIDAELEEGWRLARKHRVKKRKRTAA